MAKKTEAEMQKEQAEMAARNEESRKLAAEIGRDDSDWLKGTNEADPFEKMPTFMPGKPGFEEGQSFMGKFMRTKRIVNENSPWARLDPETGEKVTFLQVFEDRRGNYFGIWSVGGIRAACKCLRSGDIVKITYTGLGEALKKGQNAPHTFKFEGKRADGSKLSFDWDSHDVDVEMPPQHTSGTATSTQVHQ